MRIFLCQKKTYFVCLLSLFCSLFLSFAFLSSPTHAISISSTSSVTSANNSSLTYSIDYGSSITSNYTNADGTVRYLSTTYNSNITITNLIFRTGSVPANSISTLHFEFIFSGGNDFQRPYDSLSSLQSNAYTNYKVLNYNCSDNEYVTGASNRYSLSCDVQIYNTNEHSNFNLSLYFSAGINGSTTSSVLFLSYISYYVPYFVIDYDSLSTNDKDWLSDDFLDSMTDAIAEGQKQANEDVKDQTETQTQQSESTSNTQGSSSETQGQTLLQAFSSFVSAITNVQPAQNCDLDIDFTGYAPGLQTTVDLCELSPPAGLTFIGSILLILFCVPLSISTVRKLISLFRSFQT